VTALVTRGLTKRYGDVKVVDELDLTVERGELYGFLGPNGAGKTTTIRMALGLIAPSGGEVDLLGERMSLRGRPSSLARTGAMIEEPAFYKFLSGRRNLEVFAKAGGSRQDVRRRLGRIDEMLETVGLTSAANKRVKAYSQGMRQRLGLAAAMLGEPEILVLDEPTNGLDPQGMREIRSLVRELAADGTTVFLSSHLLDEIEQVCTHAAVMAQGRLLIQGPVADLAAGARGRLVVTTPDAGDAARILKEQGVSDLTVTEDRVTGEPPPKDLGKDLADLNAALVRAGVRVRGFGLERASLEDAFMALTGEGFDVAG
jgi:ABC-type multidrug transport system ATPase subunit